MTAEQLTAPHPNPPRTVQCAWCSLPVRADLPADMHPSCLREANDL